MNEKNYKQAILCFEKIVNTSSDLNIKDVYKFLPILYFKNGEHEKAKTYFEKAIKFFGNSA